MRFAGELAKVTLLQMRDGQKRFRGRIGGIDEDGMIHLDTGSGRLSFTLDEVDTAKIDPTEFFSTLKQSLRKIEAKQIGNAAITTDNEML